MKIVKNASTSKNNARFRVTKVIEILESNGEEHQFIDLDTVPEDAAVIPIDHYAFVSENEEESEEEENEEESEQEENEEESEEEENEDPAPETTSLKLYYTEFRGVRCITTTANNNPLETFTVPTTSEDCFDFSCKIGGRHKKQRVPHTKGRM